MFGASLALAIHDRACGASGGQLRVVGLRGFEILKLLPLSVGELHLARSSALATDHLGEDVVTGGERRGGHDTQKS